MFIGSYDTSYVRVFIMGTEKLAVNNSVDR